MGDLRSEIIGSVAVPARLSAPPSGRAAVRFAWSTPLICFRLYGDVPAVNVDGNVLSVVFSFRLRLDVPAVYLIAEPGRLRPFVLRCTSWVAFDSQLQ